MSERSPWWRRAEWAWLVALPVPALIDLVLWNITYGGCADTASEGGESYCWSAPVLGLEGTWLGTALSTIAGVYCVYCAFRGRRAEA